MRGKMALNGLNVNIGAVPVLKVRISGANVDFCGIIRHYA
jgi:hypothetical protein